MLFDLMSHPISKINQVLPICMPTSSSIHIMSSLVNKRNNHIKKKDYQIFTGESCEAKDSKLHRQSTRGCLRLAPSSGLHTSSSSEQRFSKGEYTYGWFSASGRISRIG
jgi:hypothetical protein